MPAAAARTAGEGSPDEDDWFVCDLEGNRLVPGTVLDFRFVPAALGQSSTPVADLEAETASEVTSASGAADTELSVEVALAPAYPNPFRDTVTLRFALPTEAHVRLSVYDGLGREVARLVDGEREAGWHEAVLDGQGLPSGVYLVRLEVGDPTREVGGEVQARRITRLR